MKRKAWMWIVTLLTSAMMIVGVLGQAGAQATPEAEEHPAAPEVVREVLSRGFPIAGEGDALELVRYVIPGNMALPAHTHPGMQTAWVESGTLHYTVLEGAVPHYRGGDLAAEPEMITPEGGEVAVETGDAIIEPEGVIHFGRNTSDEPIVLLVASLFDPEQPTAILAATPVATPAP